MSMVMGHAKRCLLSAVGVMAIFVLALTSCSRGPTAAAPGQPNAQGQDTMSTERAQVQQIYALTHSADYGNVVSEWSAVQSQSDELTAFIQGLPNLPLILQGVTVDDIRNAVATAQQVREQLASLPPLPSLLPSFPPPLPPIKYAVQELENTRADILAVTEPVAELPDLPPFISNVASLDQAKQQVASQFVQTRTVSSHTSSAFQQIKALSEKPNVRLAEFQSVCNASDWQGLNAQINEIGSRNTQLLNLVNGLPALPSSLANIPVDKLAEAVSKAKDLNVFLRSLPPLPALTDEMATLETLRLSVIKLTDTVAKLPDLPDFISGSKSLEDIRTRTLNYLVGVQGATSDSGSIMNQIDQIAGAQYVANPAPAPVITTTTTVPPTTTTQPVTTVPKPANPEIIMASTTSTRDSGLMDVLIPIFQKQTGYLVKPVYVGPGAAIAQGQSGNADVLLVHSPAAEVTFMNGGYGINRRLVMHNDFIIVGPPSDPAGIKGMTVATDALKKIAEGNINFYSRGDNSDTDVLEKSLWKKIGVVVLDNSITNPSWYIQGGAGTGMLDLLRVVSEKGGYAITDRSTYVANKAILNLAIMVQGDPGLLNVYHVIQVNPDKFPKVNAVGAQAFSDFMVAPATQTVIASYGKAQYGEALFFADAGKTEAQLGSQ